jgi:hypothetical protein
MHQLSLTIIAGRRLTFTTACKALSTHTGFAVTDLGASR